MDLMTGALGSLLPKLRDLLSDEYNLQASVKDDIRFLERELESAHAALRSVAGQSTPLQQLDELVRLWASDVRDLSYDMEDLVDAFLVRVEGRVDAPFDTTCSLRWLWGKTVGFVEKCRARRQIALAVRDVKGRVNDVSDRRDRYKIDGGIGGGVAANPNGTGSAGPGATGTAALDPRLSALYRDSDDLVGVDEPRDRLVEMLALAGDDNDGVLRLKVVAVFGAGGLGKTTLARVVRNDLKGRFDCGAFVPVGQKPDLRNVFKDVLRQLDKEKYFGFASAALDERQLIDELREFLESKRYFIVIDDLWDIRSWETIKLALIKNNTGSRIITTTRIFKVAEETGDVFVLQPLSRANSEKLFYTRMFGREGKRPDNQSGDKVLNKILKRCAGVPLAVMTMASLLAGKQIEDWSKVYSSIGFGQKDDWRVEDTTKILSFSYYDLPSHLRTCLLYLSVYPEDYAIEKELLIQRWIAEGFVLRHEQGDEGLFEIGEGYFNELVNRSMILPLEYHDQGVIGGCVVHDMVLDLLRSLAAEENFVTVLVSTESLSLQGNSRRLALQMCRKNVDQRRRDDQDTMDLQRVRSVNATRCYTVPSLVNFRVLRVLSVEHCDFTEGYRLEHLGSLVHLRYLGLIHTVISGLPKEIEKLKFLQTLDLRGTGLHELPMAVGSLRQLMWLRVDQKTWIPQGLMGKLTSLEELWILPDPDPAPEPSNNSGARSFGLREPAGVARGSFLNELVNLKELRVLRLHLDELDESVEKALAKSLRHMSKIQFLQITGASIWPSRVGSSAWEEAAAAGRSSSESNLPRRLRFLDLSCVWLPRLPAWVDTARLPSLSHLSMAVDVVRGQDLRVLGALPQLRALRLLVRRGLGADVTGEEDGDGFFRKLRFLKMPCSTLRFVVPGMGRQTVMPSLEELQFGVDVRGLRDAGVDCGGLGLHNLLGLRRLTVEVNCEDADVREVEETEAALTHAVGTHPNRPTFKLIRRFEDEMRSAEQGRQMM